MKKTLLVLLLIASLITTAFAAKGPEVMLGVSSGFNEEVKFHENIDPTTRDIVPIKADALFYLGDSLAFNTALGMDIYIPNNEYRDSSVGFVADILAYYRMNIGKNADFLVGGGAAYKYWSRTTETGPLNSSATAYKHTLALLASLRLQLGITDNISAFAGADIGYNIMNIAGTSVSSDLVGGGSSDDRGETIMPWAIKAGVNYKF